MSTRILIVEDDPMVRQFLTSRVRLEPGLEVVEAVADAASAVACLCKHEVDLVLLDYRLEGPDGMQLLHSITLWLGEDFSPSRKRPHVLFCTGLASEAFEAEARAMGARGVVAKEQVMRELIPAVSTVMQGGLWFNHQAESVPAQPVQARRRVLVADNNRPTRAALSQTLQANDYEVTLAWSYDDILALLAREPFDLLILDSRLPGGVRGTQVLDQVSERWPALPILLLGPPPGMEDFQPVPNVQGSILRPLSEAQLQSQLARAWAWAERQLAVPALV